MISNRAGQYLVEIAKEAIAHYLETGEKLEIPNDYPIELEEKLGVFVTLNKKNALEDVSVMQNQSNLQLKLQ